MPPWTRLSAGALLVSLILIPAVPTQATAGTRAAPDVWALVDKYARRYGIPLSIARNLVRVESGGRQDAVSPDGARGVMQLMPATARALGVDINDPEQNIEGGMRYLRQQYDRFGRWDLAVAAYHAGPVAVIRHQGVPPKSQAFVRRVLGSAPARSSPAPSSGTASTPRPPAGFAWPLEGTLTARFSRGHKGVDLAAPHGTPIRAARAGTVLHAGWYYDYGRTVILGHGGGVTTLYGHTSAVLVREGQAVRAGQVIARVGCTGRCTGPHVHFEMRVDGRAVDPLRSLALGATGRSPSKAPASAPPPAAQYDGQKDREGDESPGGGVTTVAGNTITTVAETMQDGQVVRRVETIVVVLEADLWIRIEREFRRVDGVLVLIHEHARLDRAATNDDDDDDEDDEDEEDDD